LAEGVQDFAARRLWMYNNERPNMTNGDFSPARKKPGGISFTSNYLLQEGLPDFGLFYPLSGQQ
jgi:hypothetical protein